MKYLIKWQTSFQFIAVFSIVASVNASHQYDIVYVRAPRYGDAQNTCWPEVKDPIQMEPGADLMLLHPDGSEEVLVKGGNGSVVDPYVSFDGEDLLLVLS